MAWQDRVKEGAYTSPNGRRFVFLFENVSKEVDKRTTGFNFPDADGTLVQDLGHSGRRYPLQMIFSGDNYDLEADAFDAALLERGEGKLEHPFYGVINVIPFGTIRRRDDLKTAGNQAVIQVTFWETIGVVYPTGSLDPASALLAAIGEFSVASAVQAALDFDFSSVIETTLGENEFQAVLDQIRTRMRTVVDNDEKTKQLFDLIYESISAGLAEQ